MRLQTSRNWRCRGVAFVVGSLMALLVPSSGFAGHAAEFIRQGDEFFAAGRSDDALAAYGTALAQADGGDTIVRASILNRLGAVHLRRAKPEQAETAAAGAKVRGFRVVAKEPADRYLAEALTLAREGKEYALVASILNNMGNLAAQKGKYDVAHSYYLQSVLTAVEADNGMLLSSASLNAARLALRSGKADDARMYLDKAYERLLKLDATTDSVNGLLLAGRLYQKHARQDQSQAETYRDRARKSFQGAFRAAETLGKDTLASYALGYEGGLLEERRAFEEARSLTRRALFRAQVANAPDLLYQWEWQLARILQASGDHDGAVKAYRRALRHLQSVRQSFEGCASCSVNFTERIEAVYLGYVDLLLRQKSGQGHSQKTLLEIIDTIEQLRTAELQNYFKDACIEVKDSRRRMPAAHTASTAIIHLVTLPDRLEILATLPNGIRHVTTSVSRDQLVREAVLFRRELAQPAGVYLSHARTLYDWVLKPLETDLSGQKIETIVVIPDGILRTVPFPALHDGTDFVLKRYAFATTQGMQLTDTSPFTRKTNSILLAGLTEGVAGFAPLPNVREEVRGIGGLFSSDILLDGEFVRPSIQRAVERKPYSMVHFATHGEFAGDSSNMFLLAWDGLLTMSQLDKIVKVTRYRDEPLELLTLSACKTAAGDDQAALGMAGIAVRAGAKSTVATLWEIDDKATSELIVEFYRQLKEGSVSKSMALRRAQVRIMEAYRHPYYWSPFLLIGNWL